MTTKQKFAHESWLQQWWDDLLRGAVSDPLFDVYKNANQHINVDDFLENKVTLAFDNPIKKILNQQKEFQQQAGVQVLCLVKEVLQWQDEKGRELQSPLYLYPLQSITDKINQTVDFELNGARFLNPFLEHFFQQKFEINLEGWIEHNNFPSSWSIIHKNIIGNFHYHRFVLLKDYDNYFQDDNFEKSILRHFFQRENSWIKNATSNNFDVIFPMDGDQHAVFDAIVNGANLTVEGPPGSGKSQVLTNLLFHAAKAQQQVVLCSEKRTALQVVAEKLKSVGLGDFCEDIANQQEAKRDFVTALKTTWEKIEKYNQSIDFDLIKINYLNLKLNIDSKLINLSNFPKLPENFVPLEHFASNLPDASNFYKYRDKLISLNKAYRLRNHQDLNTAAFLFLKPHVFDSAQRFMSFVRAVQQAISVLERLYEQLNQKFNHDWASLENLALLCIQARILSNSYFQHNPMLFVPGSKENKRFEKLRNQYQVLKNTIDLHEQKEGFKWQNPWSHEELKEAKRIFTNKSRWSATFRSWRKKFISSYEPEVFTKDLAVAAINSCLQIHEVYTQWERCLKDLAKCGIREPLSDFPAVIQLQSTVKREGQNLQDAQKKYSTDFLKQIAANDTEISDLVRFFRHNVNGLHDLPDLRSWLHRCLKEEGFCLAQLDAVAELISSAPDMYKFLPQINAFDDLEAHVFSSEIEKFKNRAPSLFHYSAADFELELEQLLTSEDAYLAAQATDFVQKRAFTFTEYHVLLSTPAAALSAAQKALKVRLRKGRSILVKEFNKSRQFMSMRELLASDAAPWIKLLKPILLLNPVVIAQVFPNEQGAIDLLLFDEASQIPFAHAIPSLYRAKQIAVFGDSKQLGPSAYFTQGSAQRIDLLSEATYHFPSKPLHFHYRSQHPDLIEYSNRYFYNSQLKMMPVLLQSTYGVFCHYVSDGTYHDGENHVESKYLTKAICSDEFKELLQDKALKIGVVAFSEKQLECIVREAYKTDIDFVNKLLNSEQLHFTTVEKVQGDEFDFLFVSLGYAKNTEGEFYLRMGPLNQEGGERRLNVLFTRARKAIHFFHSVHSSDFGHSENLGVAALKNFLVMHENSFNAICKTKNSYFSHLHFDEQTKSFECKDPQHMDNALIQLKVLKRLSRLNGFKLRFSFRKDKLV